MRTLSLGRAAITTLTALSLLAGPMLDTASAREHQTKRCAEPSADHDFGHARPGQVGLDGAALRRLLNFATSRNSSSVRVYRHGCLAATSRLDPLTQDQPVSWNSATKGVGALLVGRAIQLGKLSLDDPVATFFPHADAAHGRILLRDLITQSSGLRLSLAGDSWNAASTDGARLALHQEVVHPPGTWFEYGQHPLTLLLAAYSGRSARTCNVSLSASCSPGSASPATTGSGCVTGPDGPRAGTGWSCRRG
jgi:CubicO group peptidase (beta-lactamase class C family)